MYCIHLQPIKTECFTITSVLTSLTSQYANNFFSSSLTWEPPLHITFCAPLWNANDSYLRNILKHILTQPLFSSQSSVQIIVTKTT